MRYLIFFSIGLSLFSCKVKDDSQTGKVQDSVEIVKGKVEIPRVSINGADTVRITRVIEYNYFNCKEVYCDSTNEKIIDFVRRNTEFEHEKEQLVIDRPFFQRQLNYFDSIAREEETIAEDMPPWELELSTEIVKHDTYVDLGLNVWSYTGGAHGNGFYANILIDKSTGKTLQLSDFITDVDAFTQFAESYFRKQNSIQPGDDLGELGFWFQDNKFSLNENFHFSEVNMSFFYNSYEIAPYSAGQIEFHIPLGEMKDFLKIQP